MTKENYVKEVVKKLKCSKNKKKEIAKQLESDMQIAMENGETMEKVIERMGTPESVAADFNDNLTQAEVAAVKRAKQWKIIGIIAIVLVVLVGGIYWCLPKGKVLEESTNFNSDEVKQQTELIISLFSEGDYEQMQELSSEAMKEVTVEETMNGVKTQLGDDWGEFQDFGTSYMSEIRQMGKTYAVVQMNASYENINVTYTISFDEEMKLAGFYVK